MPPGRRYFDAIHEFGTEGGGVVVRIQTDGGVTGWAYSSFGTIAGGPRALEAILQNEVKPVLIGKDPAYPKRIRADLWRALEYAGVQGIAQFAIAAADIAIWDILGKAAGMPVYKMIGANADRMPVYNMCGWYYENDDDLSSNVRSLTRSTRASTPSRSRLVVVRWTTISGESKPHNRLPVKVVP